MATYAPPAQTQFHAKTWIDVAVAVVCGGLGGFSLLLGPLFLLRIMKAANGRPAQDAGLALTLMAIPFLLVASLAVFNLIASRRPLIRLCREALEINQIGASSLDNIPFIPGRVRVLWLLLSGQGFKRSQLLIPWQSLQGVHVSGPPMHRTLTIVGMVYRMSPGEGQPAKPVANQMQFAEAAFDAPLDRVAGSIYVHQQNVNARGMLPSWNK